MRTSFLVYRQLSCCILACKGVKKLSGDSFIRALLLSVRASPSWTNHHPKAPPPNTMTLGIRIWHMNVCVQVGDTNIQHITIVFGHGSFQCFLFVLNVFKIVGIVLCVRRFRHSFTSCHKSFSLSVFWVDNHLKIDSCRWN